MKNKNTITRMLDCFEKHDMIPPTPEGFKSNKDELEYFEVEDVSEYLFTDEDYALNHIVGAICTHDPELADNLSIDKTKVCFHYQNATAGSSSYMRFIMLENKEAGWVICLTGYPSHQYNDFENNTYGYIDIKLNLSDKKLSDEVKKQALGCLSVSLADFSEEIENLFSQLPNKNKNQVTASFLKQMSEVEILKPALIEKEKKEIKSYLENNKNDSMVKKSSPKMF